MRVMDGNCEAIGRQLISPAARKWRSKVRDGATVTVTIPADKLTNVAKCGGDGKPTAKMSNMTVNGKPSEL
jgi:hypothetical protein